DRTLRESILEHGRVGDLEHDVGPRRMLGGIAVRDERDHGDVGFRYGASAGDVIELDAHDGAITERAFEKTLRAPDSGGGWRVLGFSGDDDTLEQLDVVVLAENACVDQLQVLVRHISGGSAGSPGGRSLHARRLHWRSAPRNACRRTPWARTAAPRQTRRRPHFVASGGRVPLRTEKPAALPPPNPPAAPP